MSPSDQALEWIRLRFPVGTRVKLPKSIPISKPYLSCVESMFDLFGSDISFKVIDYARLEGEPHWALILDTTQQGKKTTNFWFASDWVMKEKAVLEEAETPTLEPVVEKATPGEISWGAALGAPLAALFGIAAAKKTFSHLSKPVPKTVIQEKKIQEVVTKGR